MEIHAVSVFLVSIEEWDAFCFGNAGVMVTFRQSLPIPTGWCFCSPQQSIPFRCKFIQSFRWFDWGGFYLQRLLNCIVKVSSLNSKWKSFGNYLDLQSGSSLACCNARSHEFHASFVYLNCKNASFLIGFSLEISTFLWIVFVSF